MFGDYVWNVPGKNPWDGTAGLTIICPSNELYHKNYPVISAKTNFIVKNFKKVFLARNYTLQKDF